jgi:putative transcriptional regulator
MATGLAPGFLVAAPGLLDPGFARTVVLLVEHRAEGALGFVLNRPSRISFARVVSELDLGAPDRAPPEVPVLNGGPVAPHTGWLIYDPARVRDRGVETIEVTGGVRVSASRALLGRMAVAGDAARRQLVLGYSGWGAGQLDAELRRGAWVPVGLDEGVVFDTPLERRWEAALNAAGIDPRLLVSAPVPS